MKEKLILQALSDLGTGTTARISHYIEDATGHELSAASVKVLLRWLHEKGLVSTTTTDNRQLFQLTKEGKRVAREGE